MSTSKFEGNIATYTYEILHCVGIPMHLPDQDGRIHYLQHVDGTTNMGSYLARYQGLSIRMGHGVMGLSKMVVAMLCCVWMRAWSDALSPGSLGVRVGRPGCGVRWVWPKAKRRRKRVREEGEALCLLHYKGKGKPWHGESNYKLASEWDRFGTRVSRY